MKYKDATYVRLESQPFFHKKDIYQLGEKYGIYDATVDTNISRSLKRGEIVPLKNGLYVAANYLDAHKGDESYLFYLANIVRGPSYVSGWTALQHYDLATEAIHTITSVTLKNTRSYDTKAGVFTYQSIRNDLFTGFNLENGAFDYFIASPAKALFDLLYFKTRQYRGLKFDDIAGLVEGLRIDIDEMDASERENFYSMAREQTNG